MKCLKARDLMPRYCSGELDDDTRRQVEEHISGCSECRKEMEQERSLGRVLGQSLSDDPPEEYWNDYNAKVRSRVRGATGMLWRLGVLPGCLFGLIFGFAELVGWWHFASSTTGSPVLRTIKMLVVGGLLVFVVFFLFKRFTSHGLPGYERDERSLKQTAARNPAYRWTIISLLALLQLAVAVYIPLMATMDQLMPGWAIWTLRVILFIGFASYIPAYCRMIMDYLDGRNIQAEWARKSLKQRVTAFPLLKIAVLFMLAALIWNAGMSTYVSAPTECSLRADDLFSNGDTQSAVSILKSGIRKYGDRYRVLYCYTRLGYIYEETGHPAEARDAFRAGIRAYEYLVAHPKPYYRKQDRLWLLGDAASLYIALGENNNAFDVSKARLQMAPDDPENIVSVALDYDLASYEDEAKALYTRVIIEFSSSTWADIAKDSFKALH